MSAEKSAENSPQKLRNELGSILRRLCEYKRVELIEGKLYRDHISNFKCHSFWACVYYVCTVGFDKAEIGYI